MNALIWISCLQEWDEWAGIGAQNAQAVDADWG